MLFRFMQDDQAQDMIEYALLLVFIALAALVAFEPVAQSITSIWVRVDEALRHQPT